MAPDFVALMPVCNAANDIDMGIESLLKSTHDNFMLLCFDDHSSDDTVRRIKAWEKKDSRVVLATSPEGYGREKGKPFGFELSVHVLMYSLPDAPFLFFVRPQDRVSPYFMKSCFDVFRKHDPDAVFCRTMHWNGNDSDFPVVPDFKRTERIAMDPEDKSWFMRHDTLQGIVFQRMFFVDGLFVRKELESKGLNFHLGNEMFLRYKVAAHSQKLAENPDAVYFFHSERPDRFSYFPRYENYDLARHTHFVEPYQGHFLRSRDLLQGFGFNRDSFRLFELDFLIRLHRRLAEDPSLEGALSENISEQFAEIGEGFDEETKEFFHRTEFFPPRQDFVRNILGMKDTALREMFPVSYVLRESVPGPVRSPAADPEVYFENDSLRILSWNVGKGKLGINESGYDATLSVPGNDRNEPLLVLSAHCPSTIRIDVKKPIAVSGMLDEASDIDVYSPCRFYVSKKNIGNPVSPRVRTETTKLEPGMHELEIRSMDPENKRSLWLFEEMSEFPDGLEFHGEDLFFPEKHASESDEKAIGILMDRPVTDTISVLRAFALRTFFESAGYEAEIVRFDENEQKNSPDGSRDSMRYQLHENFERFYREHVEPPRRKPINAESNPSAPCSTLVLTGRFDEILSPMRERIPGNSRQVGFSLYISNNIISEEQRKNIRSRLATMSAVSVLDDASAETVRNLGFASPRTTWDPLFLPGREQWNSLAGEMNPDVKPYLLVHLHEANSGAVDVARRLASFFGCEILLASPNVLPEEFLREAARTVHRSVAVAPQAFLGLIRHARFVVTDSYCGTVFSLIGRKPFVTMTRQTEKNPDFAAISGLLASLGLESQWIRLEKGERQQMKTELPFDEIEEKIRLGVAESAEFLLNAVKRNSTSKSVRKIILPVPKIIDRKVVFPPGGESVASPFPATSKRPNADFTVGITTYNLENFIDDTVASVLRSTYENFRLVISDNQSTDRTFEKLEQWAKTDSRIVLLRNRTNIGVLGNVGVVYRHIRTPYAVWLDGDDMISPYYMETVKREFERHDVDGIFFQTVFIDENGQYMHGGTGFGQASVLSEHPAGKAYYFCRPATSYKNWAQLFMQRMLKTVFHNPGALRAHMDVYSNIYSIAGSRKILEIPDALYYRRIRAGSITQQAGNESQLDAVSVYESSKQFLIRHGYWNDYKDLFLRYKLNHLMWLYGHIAVSFRPRLISMVAEKTDQEERWFYREAKFPLVQRNFIRQVLKITDFQVASGNVFPESVSWTPEMLDETRIACEIPDVAKKTGTCFENDFLAVHSWNVGIGRLGINASGVGGPLVSPPEFSDGFHAILGASCPSKIHVSFKRPVSVSGFMNGTTRWSANTNCLFFVSENPLGFLCGPGEKTAERIVEPGFYVLETAGLDPQFKHSAWAIREVESEKIRVDTQREEFSRRPKSRAKKKKAGNA